MQKYTPFLVKFNYFHTQSINKCQIVHQFVTIFTKLNNCAAAACLLNILAATHTTFVAPRLKYSTYPRSGAVHSLSLCVSGLFFSAKPNQNLHIKTELKLEPPKVQTTAVALYIKASVYVLEMKLTVFSIRPQLEIVIMGFKRIF